MQTFSGKHQHVLAYLSEEVLARQPVEVQQFLLATSILDRLSAPLCEAVTNQQGAQVMLERLVRANLFLTSLDHEDHWYRYHPLFADLLRDRLER
ncbi:hypothetical protein EPA93_35725 [Ktedonosporobacter rubrisoli]|uniref:MalT-like winged helix domain-containing protein n=1 Tax=Ktedonosporobacter rubrisoli TaxID=2509675 RepID=A0A4P6JZI7_KTERU|nr:hypothetical protein [Ktedonosporobacter rubrisoli]QBD81035.1 hypothetical protein EPA93_35725 [Ktedonosporobacter rubrisoli]